MLQKHITIIAWFGNTPDTRKHRR